MMSLLKLFHYRVTCAFIKNKQLAFSHKLLSRLRIWTHNFKGCWLSIKSATKNLVFFFRLIIDSSLKLLHIEIVSLWIKTIVNLSQCLKPYLRQLLKNFIGDLFAPLQRVCAKNICQKFPWFQKKPGKQFLMGFPLKALLSLQNKASP